ncbi:hypothetical protein GCK32_004353, partial [Trichostrongylus colubriformis]
NPAWDVALFFLSFRSNLSFSSLRISQQIVVREKKKIMDLESLDISLDDYSLLDLDEDILNDVFFEDYQWGVSHQIGQCISGCFSSVQYTIGKLLLVTLLQRFITLMSLPTLVKHISCIFLGILVFPQWIQRDDVRVAIIVVVPVMLLFLLLTPLPSKGATTLCASIGSIICMQYLIPAQEFLMIRGILMIFAMKVSALAFDKGSSCTASDIIPILAYLFGPATSVFGPFHTFDDYMKSLNRRSIKEEVSSLFLSVTLVAMAFFFLAYSSCVSILLPEGSTLTDYITAQSFRTSHYFVCMLSEGLAVLSGMRLYTCSPFAVEVPRSLVEVVVAWNIPMHRFLHSCAFRCVYELGHAGAVIMRRNRIMADSHESLMEIESALNHLSDELDKFDATWEANMSKVLSSADLYDRELLSEDAEPEMSVTAQMLLEEVAARGEETLTQMLAHHKALHHPVSQIGKEIDKSTQKEIGGLIRNEKDIERDPKAERLVNGMICDYLMTCGHTNIAETLVKETGLGGRIDGYLANRKIIDWIMEALKSQDIEPALSWLQQNPHSDTKLQYDLLKQHMITLIQDGKRVEAMRFGRQLSAFGYENETAQVMGAVVMGRERNDPRYEALFSPLAWPMLESRMSVALAQNDTRFLNVILTGMRAVPILVNLKQVMVGRQDHLFSGEELPVELRSHVKVLSEGVISERKKNDALNETIRELEVQLRKVESENESLTFRNEQLVKRVESLQDELEASVHGKTGLKKSKSVKKSKDTKDLLNELGTLENRVAVLEEELQNKIRQNMELTSQMCDLEQKHTDEISSLSNDFARKLEDAEARRFDSDRRKEHRPERPVKSVKPLEQSMEISNVLSQTPSPHPPPIDEAYLQVAESVRNTLQGLSTLFELLYQRTQIYPFDSSLESLPSHVKKLSSELAQCSQLLTAPIDVVQQCILKAEFEMSRDVTQLHTSLKVVVRHCKVMMPELLKRLATEENKVTWCDSQLEDLNNAWCAGMIRLLAVMDSMCSALALTTASSDNAGKKLCETLEEGNNVIRELDKTFATRWAVESRFPTATKRICCVGTATSHCLSRLVTEMGKLTARVHAINGLFEGGEKGDATPVRAVRSPDAYNPFDEDCETASVEETRAKSDKPPTSTIGVDTSDLASGDAESLDMPNVPSNSSNTSICSKSESVSDQIMVDCLKTRVSALESEREGHLVDLSLLRRKLAMLGVKEVEDDRHSEVEMLKQVNRERLRAVADSLQTAQCAANYYKGECTILLRKNFLCTEEKRVLEETVKDMKKEIATLTDELASVRRGYDHQLSQMTEHVADLNGKLADIEREKAEQRGPVTPQRSGLKSLFMK